MGLLDKAQLEHAESVAAALGAEYLYNNPPRKTDLPYLKSIHRTLFGQIYPWAGETRRYLGRMTKIRPNGTVVQYGDSSFVDAELTRMLGLLASENFLKGLPLETFAIRAAYFYGELDAIHSFREGNSRTLRAFFHAIAHNAGFHLNWGRTGVSEDARNTLYAARDHAVMHGNSTHLAAIFHAILSPR